MPGTASPRNFRQASTTRQSPPISRQGDFSVFKAAVRHGDPTTTRGIVIAFSSTILDDGKQVALSGDEATCGDCDGIFKIIGSGKDMSENGRNVVVDGDWVICPCKKNRVIVGNNPGIFLESSGSEHPAESSARRQHSTTPIRPIHDEQIRLIDRFSGRVLTNIRYRGPIRHFVGGAMEWTPPTPRELRRWEE
ncbi:PAAR domain-containing protein [Burkholderia pyrrocinia]|uniref:PAAR domain-containing protein n=1 Tax=Burkholderia pyrrocinia TaxID=60550 RepID=UPI0030D48AB7